MTQVWNDLDSSVGCAFSRFKDKLKNDKFKLRSWVVEEKEKRKRQKNKVVNRLFQIDKEIDGGVFQNTFSEDARS